MVDKKYSVNTLQKGLVTDVNKSVQPEGTYSYALNAVNETVDGNQGYLSNERGNTSCLNLFINNIQYILIGHINLLNNEVVLFLTNETSTKSIIGIQKGCTFTPIIEEACLNFNIHNQIRGIYKIRKGCNRVIYFVDYNNPDRSIDLDEIINNPTGHKYLDVNGNFDCSLIKLAPDYKYPTIKYLSTNRTGGNLKLGVYQFSIGLGDKNLNFTNWITVTKPIPVIDSNFDNTFNSMGGNPEFVISNQSINLELQNLDTSFDFVKLAVIETISGVSTAYEVDTLPLVNNTLQYTYKGVVYDSAIKVTLAEIAEPKIVFDVSKTIEQHDQRLIRGNIKEKIFDYGNLQRAACLIKTKYVTKPIRYNDVNKSTPSGNYYVDNRSYMRDEIYALGIKVLFTDGTESAAFHIPGREIDKNLPTNIDPNAGYPLFLTNRNPPNGLWDSSEYTVVDAEDINGHALTINNQIEVALSDVEHLSKTVGSKIKRWEVFNTALRTYCSNNLQNSADSNAIFTSGELSYWESQYTYGNVKDCTNKPIFGEFDLNGNLITDYSNQKLRHHKMPDTTLEPHFLNTNNNNGWVEDDFILPLGIEFDLTNFHQYILNNISLIDRNKITGYKIVRAKRDFNNKTVIDKGLSFRNMLWYYDKNNLGTYSPSNIKQFQTNVFNRYLEVLRGSGSNNYNIVTTVPALFNVNEALLKNNSTITPNPSSLQGTSVSNQNNDFEAIKVPTAKSILWYDSYNISYHGAKSKFNKQNLNASYIKYEKQLWGQCGFYGPGADGSYGEKKLLFRYFTHFNNTNEDSAYKLNNGDYTQPDKYLGTPCLNTTNRIINKQKSVEANKLARSGLQYEFANGTQQEAYVCELNKKIDNIGTTNSILDNTRYISGSPKDFFKQTAFTGFDIPGNVKSDPTSISKAYYLSIKSQNNTIYNQLSSVRYYDVSNKPITTENIIQEFSGDIFISLLSFRKTFLDNNYRDLDEFTQWANVVSYYGESEINTSLRHMRYGTAQDVSRSKFFPKFNTTDDILDLLWRNDFAYQGVGILPDDDYVTDIVQENKVNNNEYFYNIDYSKEETEKLSLPLTQGFDYCSKCLNKFPHRIVFSEKSYQEELADNFLKVKANSYRDVPGNGGEITDIFKKSDELFLKTFQSLWLLQTKPQQLQTTGGQIEVGIGDFLSIPPKEVSSTKTGYAGGQTRWDLSVSEYGVLFADQLQGKIFHYNNELNEISNNGNRNWFEENLPSKLLKLYPNYDYKDNTTSLYGIGLISVYDSRHKRWILTKKEFYPLDIKRTIFSNGKWYHNEQLIIDPYIRQDLFENLSWTMSYDLMEQKWISYHSYLPNYIYNTQSEFYSTILNSQFIWQHNTSNYQNYYNTKYPYVFEFISNNDALSTKTFNSIHYITQVSEYNTQRKEFVDIQHDTFDKVIFYNDYQISGELDILVKNNNDPFSSVQPLYDASQIYADRNERNWSFNQLRDMCSNLNEPLFTKDWLNTQYQLKFPIDKVVNSNVINYFKSQFEMQKFRDKYLATRLSYNKPNNRKITTKYLVTQNKESLR